MSVAGKLDPARAVADLRELAELTSDEAGAQRVAWGSVWAEARKWLEDRLGRLPVEVSRDEAGNLWATSFGEGPHLALAGHLDSVPDGGWLDGALGTVAGLHVLEALLEEGVAGTVSLIDWADEEGRFGRALLGSGLATGQVDAAACAGLTDRDGRELAEVLAENGVDVHSAHRAGEMLNDLDAYLELHIEQGPVLESRGLPLAAVTGSAGLERHRATFRGQSSHAGSTPMDVRRDAFLAAARLAVEARAAVRGSDPAVLATTGQISATPNIPTAIAGVSQVTLDVRSADAEALASAWAEIRDLASRIAGEESVELGWEVLQRIDPVDFDPRLVEVCAGAVAGLSGEDVRLVSGPLHDACSVAGAGVPAAMLFVKSLGGISHAAEEDSDEADLVAGVEALHEAARAALDRQRGWR